MSKTQKIPDPYKIDRLAMIPAPVKAIVIKWWFAGAVFFLIGMGVPAVHSLSDNLDLVLALGIVMGMVNDILVNNIFRFMRTDKSIYDVWMVFPKKSIISFFLNIIYYVLASFAVYFIYNLINKIAVDAGFVEAEHIFLPVEPVGYGIVMLLVDMIVLGIKALVRKQLSGKKESSK